MCKSYSPDCDMKPVPKKYDVDDFLEAFEEEAT
jgi:hypothetical protein